MHELSVTKGLIKTIMDRFDSTTMDKVLEVKLVMGGMYDYEEKWLQRYMHDLSEGTPLEDATLKIEKKPISFKCRSCENIFEMELHGKGDVGCPNCGSYEYDMYTGREFYITSMEVLWK
jgi:hydrogenase nickel incorporation protein HypA/HybF